MSSFFLPASKSAPGKEITHHADHAGPVHHKGMAMGHDPEIGHAGQSG